MHLQLHSAFDQQRKCHVLLVTTSYTMHLTTVLVREFISPRKYNFGTKHSSPTTTDKKKINLEKQDTNLAFSSTFIYFFSTTVLSHVFPTIKIPKVYCSFAFTLVCRPSFSPVPFQDGFHPPFQFGGKQVICALRSAPSLLMHTVA